MANNLDAFIPEIWERNIIQKIRQTNVMLPMANKNYEGEIQKKGDTVWVRTFGEIILQPYQRGQPIAYQDLQPTKESMVIDDAEMFAFTVDDLDTAQSDINTLDGYTEEANVKLNNAVEAKLLGQYASAPAANRVTNSGSPITITASNAYTTLTDAALAMDNQGVPQGGRWAVLTPTYKNFLTKDANVTRASDLGDQVVSSGTIPAPDGSGRFRTVAEAMQQGFVGVAAGFNLFMSTAIPSDGTARYCQFGQGNPIAYAAQLREVEALRLEQTFATAIRGLLLHGAKIFAESAKKFGYIAINPAQ